MKLSEISAGSFFSNYSGSIREVLHVDFSERLVKFKVVFLDGSDPSLKKRRGPILGEVNVTTLSEFCSWSKFRSSRKIVDDLILSRTTLSNSAITVMNSFKKANSLADLIECDDGDGLVLNAKIGLAEVPPDVLDELVRYPFVFISGSHAYLTVAGFHWLLSHRE